MRDRFHLALQTRQVAFDIYKGCCLAQRPAQQYLNWVKALGRLTSNAGRDAHAQLGNVLFRVAQPFLRISVPLVAEAFQRVALAKDAAQHARAAWMEATNRAFWAQYRMRRTARLYRRTLRRHKGGVCQNHREDKVIHHVLET